MARVVVVTQDLDVQTVLEVFLQSKRHAVLSVPDAQHALPALEVGPHPAVVIIHAPTAADEELDLLRQAASSGGKRLARHSYIILTDEVMAASSEHLARAARLKAEVLELPFDLEELAIAVQDAEYDLLAPARSLPPIHALPPQPPLEA